MLSMKKAWKGIGLLLQFSIALCLLLAGPSQAAPTSELRFQRLGALGADELSILSTMQDRQGFVWIGTHASGLYRYNGYAAVKYLNSPQNNRSLPHDRVSTLFEDRKGRIWAGTQNGLARFNPETNDFTRFVPPPGHSNQLIIKLIISDGKDGMWIATWGGLQHFDPDTGKFETFVHDPSNPDSLAANDLNALALDRQGGLWIGTWPGGLDYLPPKGRSFVHYRVDRPEAPDPKANIVRALTIDHEGTLWMGTENSVVTWKAGTHWDTRTKLDAPATRINWFYADRNRHMWAGTLSSGLLRFDGSSPAPQRYVHRATDPHSLPSDNVRAIMQDRSGMLWIATFTDGICLTNLNSQGFRRLIPFDIPREGLVSNALNNIAGAPGGKLWLGGNTGFALFDPKTGTVEKTWLADAKRPGALTNGIVYSTYQQPDGPLWIGTSAGLHRLDRPDGPISVIRFGSVAGNFINSIAGGSNGTLWLGTGANVVHYDPATGKYNAYSNDPKAKGARSVSGTTTIAEDRQRRVWMGSEWNGGGLDMLDLATGKITNFRHVAGDPRSLADDNVSTVYLDPRGRMWVGTAKGVNEIITGKDGAVNFRSFAQKGSVGQAKVLAMRTDNAGKLWMSTAAGLVRLDPDSGQVARFSASDGMTEGFTIGAAYASPDGTLYFGGVKGMTAVEPDKVRTSSVPPQVAITDISVFNRSLTDGKPAADINLSGPVTAPTQLTLSVQESVFSLEFAALHYTNPARNTYAYRLAGFDRDWVETDAARRTATYTNLNPGDYTFQVKAANDQGVWSEQATSLKISIMPPFWQTWWFRAAVALTVFGILAAIYRIRVRRLTRQQAMLQALVAERTRELQESNAKLEELSTTDGLTGVTNRRGFDAALANEWRRARRTGQAVSLAMMDVDHFKAYNDHYGHQAGDQALRAVAQLIAAHGRRTSDVVARYGGEEFALLMPDTDAARVMRLVQDICAEVQRLALPHSKSPYSVVTISIGVATLWPRDGGTIEQLILDADQALYRAKEGGRNQAIAASAPAPV
jgi:diguanylate cyclase (GGDEF)-like protein